MDMGLTAVLAGAVGVLALFAANAWLTVKRGQGSRLVSRLTYALAALVVAANIWRFSGDGSTVQVANLVALICIAVSFYRSERSPLTLPEE